MAELELSLKDNASKQIEKIQQEMDALRKTAVTTENSFESLQKQLGKKQKELSSLKSIVGPEPKNEKIPKIDTKGSEKNVGGLVERVRKSRDLFSQPIGQIAGRFGFFGDLVESTSDKMLAQGGKLGSLGLAITGIGVSVGLAIGALYGAGKALLFIGEAHSKAATHAIKTKASLGSLASEYENIQKSSFEAAQSVGVDMSEMEESVISFRKVGMTIGDSMKLGQIDTIMKKIGKTDFTSALDKLKAAKPKQTLQELMSPEEFQKAFDGFGISASGASSAIQVLNQVLASGEIGTFMTDAQNAADPMIQLQNAFKDFTEQVFKAPEMKVMLDDVFAFFKDPKNIEKAVSFFKGLKQIAEDTLGVVGTVIKYWDKVKVAGAGFAVGAGVGAITGPGAIITGLAGAGVALAADNAIDVYKENNKSEAQQGMPTSAEQLAQQANQPIVQPKSEAVRIGTSTITTNKPLTVITNVTVSNPDDVKTVVEKNIDAAKEKSSGDSSKAGSKEAEDFYTRLAQSIK